MGQGCLHEHAFAAYAERLRTWNIASSLCRLKGVACTWTLIVTSVGRYPSTKLIAAKLNRACPQKTALGAEFTSAKYETLFT